MQEDDIELCKKHILELKIRDKINSEAINNINERCARYQEYIYSEMNIFIKGLKSLSRWALAITILVFIDIIVRLI